MRMKISMIIQQGLKIMKLVFISVCCVLSFALACTGIDPEEAKAIGLIGLNTKDAEYVKSVTKSKIVGFYGADTDEAVNAPAGISMDVDFDRTESVRKTLSVHFAGGGFLVFLSKQNYDAENKKNILSIIRSEDQFDILRIQKTIDTRAGKTTQMIIDRLAKWKASFDFTITGAESYWVEASFVSMPSDMTTFATELAGYCPEIMNDGTGKIEDLVTDMKNRGSFFLFFR
jgi:hypothetical protein